MTRRKARVGVAAIATVAAIIGLTCVSPSPADEPAGEAGTEQQGVTGKVVRLEGNFMPGPGASGGKRTPLAVPVCVFRGKIKVFQAPVSGHPALVKRVLAATDGSFRCPLEPGEYTVVAEIAEKMYLNTVSFDGKDAFWATLHVEKEKWTNWTIMETSAAAF